jgi:uncharacterized membrane protein
MLKKALRHVDEGITRLAVLSLGSLLWPLVVAVSGGAAAWMLTHRDKLALVGTNRLPQELRMGALVWAAVSLGVVLLVHLLANLVVRWRSGEFQSLRVMRAVNQGTSFVVGLPFAAALMTPNIESKRAFFTLFYALAAALCCVPTFRLFARRERIDEGDDEHRRRYETVAKWSAALLVGLLVLGYGLFFSKLSITNHHGMGSRTIDLGYYDNIFYQSIHGRPLACSFLKAGNHASAHFDPILVILSPLYLIYPRAEALLALQSFWLASGVVPAYLMGRHALGSRWAGLAIGVVYALHPALHGANMYEFHSLTLIAPAVVWALYFLESGKIKLYWVSLAVLLLIREDVPLLMCFVGAYAILSRRKGYARIGWLTVLVSIAYFAVVKLVFMTSSDILNAGPESYGFSYYYRDMIPNKTGFRGLLMSLLSNPSFVLSHALSEPKLEFMLKLLVPLGFLPLFARPGRFILVYGAIFTLLATRKPVFQTSFQYAMLLVPAMVALTPVGLRRLRDGRTPDLLGVSKNQLVVGALGAIVVCSLLVSWRFGGIWENSAFRGGFTRPIRELSDVRRARYAKIRELVAMIEPGAGVTVTNKTGPHASNRRHVYMYRQKKVKESHYVFIDTRDLKGKVKAWHGRRVKRKELELLGGYKTVKLFRFHPEFEHADSKGKPASSGSAAPKDAKDARPKRGKPGPKRRPPPKPRDSTKPDPAKPDPAKPDPAKPAKPDPAKPPKPPSESEGADDRIERND